MRKNSLCLDCGIDTMVINQFYLLHDELWARVNPAITGMLCLECVEKRLGRQLTLDDFKPGQEDGTAAHGNRLARQRICRDGGAALDAAFERLKAEAIENLKRRRRKS